MNVGVGGTESPDAVSCKTEASIVWDCRAIRLAKGGGACWLVGTDECPRTDGGASNRCCRAEGTSLPLQGEREIGATKQQSAAGIFMASVMERVECCRACAVRTGIRRLGEGRRVLHPRLPVDDTEAAVRVLHRTPAGCVSPHRREEVNGLQRPQSPRLPHESTRPFHPPSHWMMPY